MSNLVDQITILANGLVEGILDAVRETSLSDLGSAGTAREVRSTPFRKASLTKTFDRQVVASGRLPRRSPADLEKVVGLVVGALGKAKEGLRSEQLQETLKLSKKEIVGPLTLALSEKKIVKKGQKRATTYFVATRKKVVAKPVKKVKAKAKPVKKSLKSARKRK